MTGTGRAPCQQGPPVRSPRAANLHTFLVWEFIAFIMSQSNLKVNTSKNKTAVCWGQGEATSQLASRSVFWPLLLPRLPEPGLQTELS